MLNALGAHAQLDRKIMNNKEIEKALKGINRTLKGSSESLKNFGEKLFHIANTANRASLSFHELTVQLSVK